MLIVIVLTVAGPVVTPSWLALVGGAAAPASGKMMVNLVWVLLLPVGVAQASRSYGAVARWATRQQTAIGVIARLSILVVMLKAAVEVAANLPDLTPGVVILVVVATLSVHVAALTVGLTGGRALGFARVDSLAVAFAGSQKTLPVALYLYQDYYAAAYPLAVLPLALYHVGQFIVDTLVADRLGMAPPDKEKTS